MDSLTTLYWSLTGEAGCGDNGKEALWAVAPGALLRSLFLSAHSFRCPSGSRPEGESRPCGLGKLPCSQPLLSPSLLILSCRKLRKRGMFFIQPAVMVAAAWGGGGGSGGVALALRLNEQHHMTFCFLSFLFLKEIVEYKYCTKDPATKK